MDLKDKTAVMEPVADITDPAVFEEHLAHFEAWEWFQELKRKAFEQFQALPMPVRMNEKWRYSGIGKVDLEGYHFCPAGEVPEQFDLVKHSNLTMEFAGRMVFEDNHLLDHHFVEESLAEQGVVWGPVMEALRSHEELLKAYLGKLQAELGGDKFYQLHLAYLHAGAVVYVPKNVVIERPLVNYHWTNREHGVIFPHTLVIAESGAQVELIDVYGSQRQDTGALSLGVAHAFAHKNALVRRKEIQVFNPHVVSFQLNGSVVEQDGAFKSVALPLGGQLVRTENAVWLRGKGADAKLYSAVVAEEGQEIDQRTKQIHEAEHATSDLLYKNALMENGKTIFSGMIEVKEEAQHTDAYQTNRNLLLSNQAEANSLPGLEISANEVKCSHGATTGEIDQAELFYLMSRGVPLKMAEALLVFGFFEEILELITNTQVGEHVRALIHQKFIDKEDSLHG